MGIEVCSVGRSDAPLVERFAEAGRVHCAAPASFSRGALAGHFGGRRRVAGWRTGRRRGQFIGPSFVAVAGRRRSDSNAANPMGERSPAWTRPCILHRRLLLFNPHGSRGEKRRLRRKPMAGRAFEKTDFRQPARRPFQAPAQRGTSTLRRANRRRIHERFSC
jgi:hypothetical protein